MLAKLIKRSYKVPYAQNNSGKHNYIRAPLDPRLNHAWIGRVFIPKSRPHEEGEEKYLKPSIEIIFTYLKNKYPEFTYNFEDYNKIKNNTFFVYEINLEKEKENLLEILSENLVLKNHQFRHSIEKLQRKQFSHLIFQNMKLGELSLKEFFEHYSELCEILVEQSRKFNSLESDLDFSGIDLIYAKKGREKIFVEEENMNFINKMMQWVHS